MRSTELDSDKAASSLPLLELTMTFSRPALCDLGIENYPNSVGRKTALAATIQP
jgi:hypothetical protein